MPLPGQVTAEDCEQETLEGDLIHGRCSVNVVQLIKKMYERCGFNDNVALMIAAVLQRIPRRPLDTSTTRRHDPAEEGEQGTLEGALPDPIFKVTNGGEEEGHQGSFVMLASRDTQDENNGRFPLDDPSTILGPDCRARAQ